MTIYVCMKTQFFNETVNDAPKIQTGKHVLNSQSQGRKITLEGRWLLCTGKYTIKMNIL